MVKGIITLSPPIKLPEEDVVEIQFGFELNITLSIAVSLSFGRLVNLKCLLIGFIYLKSKNLIKLFPKIRIQDIKPKIYEKNKSKDEIDIILEKLKLDGWEGLSDLKKKQLYSASQYFSKDQSPN